MPKSKTLAEITSGVLKHCEPKRAVIVERFRFPKRDQAMGESVADHVVVLDRLSIHCKFEGYLDDALCDCFVCGILTKAIQ